jgi:hypothetical protein
LESSLLKFVYLVFVTSSSKIFQSLGKQETKFQGITYGISTSWTEYRATPVTQDDEYAMFPCLDALLQTNQESRNLALATYKVSFANDLAVPIYFNVERDVL